MSVSDNAVVVLRRFGGRDLSGADLETIRQDVLGLTQEDVASQWNYSRTYISRMESAALTNQRIQDLYLGLLFRHFLYRNLGA